MPDIAKSKPTECGNCAGRGQHVPFHTILIPRKEGSKKLKTVQRGCGCSQCLGTGQLKQENAR